MRRPRAGNVSRADSLPIGYFCETNVTLPMNPRTLGLFLAVSFSVFWIAVLYAGADHPVPKGFVLAFILSAIAGVLVYLRVPTYMEWSRARRKLRHLRVVGDGVIVGVVFATIPLLIPGNGEPTVHPTLGDRLIWYAVLSFVGVANTVVVYLISAIAAKLSVRRAGVS